MLDAVQFKSKTHSCHPESRTCKNCRNPALDAWRLAETGMASFGCPYGKPMTHLVVSAPAVKESLTVAKPKPARAPQEVIELRVLMDCNKRTLDGKCTACRTCKGTPSCRSVAEWRRCPEGFWEETKDTGK